MGRIRPNSCFPWIPLRVAEEAATSCTAALTSKGYSSAPTDVHLPGWLCPIPPRHPRMFWGPIPLPQVTQPLTACPPHFLHCPSPASGPHRSSPQLLSRDSPRHRRGLGWTPGFPWPRSPAGSQATWPDMALPSPLASPCQQVLCSVLSFHPKLGQILLSHKFHSTSLHPQLGVSQPLTALIPSHEQPSRFCAK